MNMAGLGPPIVWTFFLLAQRAKRVLPRRRVGGEVEVSTTTRPAPGSAISGPNIQQRKKSLLSGPFFRLLPHVLMKDENLKPHHDAPHYDTPDRFPPTIAGPSFAGADGSERAGRAYLFARVIGACASLNSKPHQRKELKNDCPNSPHSHRVRLPPRLLFVRRDFGCVRGRGRA